MARKTVSRHVYAIIPKKREMLVFGVGTMHIVAVSRICAIYANKDNGSSIELSHIMTNGLSK